MTSNLLPVAQVRSAQQTWAAERHLSRQSQTEVSYPELLALYEAASSRLRTFEFIDINRYLSRAVYMVMSKEVHTASQKEVAAFPMPREGRDLSLSKLFR